MVAVKNVMINSQTLQSLLDSKGITHYRLAQITGISEASISRIFKSHSASYFHLRLICDATGINADEILCFNDSEPVKIAEAKPPKVTRRKPASNSNIEPATYLGFESFIKFLCIEKHYQLSDNDIHTLYLETRRMIINHFEQGKEEKENSHEN